MADLPSRFTLSPDAAAVLDATGFTGTILLHQAATDTWLASHPDLATRRFIPASTFKILSSLIAVETGMVAHADALVPWDGQASGRPVIDRHLTLREAFRLSAVPHYRSMIRELGARRMQSFIDAVGYGNGDLSGGIGQFWLTGGLRISPVEQIGFLRRLHRGELPFLPETMATVRHIMSAETGPDHRIRAKTGWAVTDTDLNTGWWTGWVERPEAVWYFATVLQSREPGTAFGPARLDVTRRVLTQAGALPA